MLRQECGTEDAKWLEKHYMILDNEDEVDSSISTESSEAQIFESLSDWITNPWIII